MLSNLTYVPQIKICSDMVGIVIRLRDGRPRNRSSVSSRFLSSLGPTQPCTPGVSGILSQVLKQSERETNYSPINRRLSGSQGRLGGFGEEKYLSPLPGIAPRYLGYPARSHVVCSKINNGYNVKQFYKYEDSVRFLPQTLPHKELNIKTGR
jgi:hypothetical protein